MEKYKFCCKGNTATMVKPLWPVIIKDVKWYRALYHCPVCGDYTIRSEANIQSFNTKVEFVSKEQSDELMIEADERKKQKELNYVGT